MVSEEYNHNLSLNYKTDVEVSIVGVLDDIGQHFSCDFLSLNYSADVEVSTLGVLDAIGRHSSRDIFFSAMVSLTNSTSICLSSLLMYFSI
jgi:hypothetical protein